MSDKDIDAFLSLGTNLGDREANLRRGARLLCEHLSPVACSSIYETDPVGVRDQPPFLNMVILVRTDLTPPQLLTLAKSVEQEVGRRPTFRWGPRVLDVDILLYGDQKLDLPDLQIPHPEMLSRAFVLVPLCEIAPDVQLPDGSSICEKYLPTHESGVRRWGTLSV